jgi:hypothetical protein
MTLITNRKKQSGCLYAEGTDNNTERTVRKYIMRNFIQIIETPEYCRTRRRQRAARQKARQNRHCAVC